MKTMHDVHYTAVKSCGCFAATTTEQGVVTTRELRRWKAKGWSSRRDDDLSLYLQAPRGCAVCRPNHGAVPVTRINAREV